MDFSLTLTMPAGLADGALEILQMNSSNWQAMSAAAELTARSYTWDDAAERFESALVEAVERKD